LCTRLGVEPQTYLRRAQPYLTTQQLRDLHADGFTIGAHSCSHRPLQDLAPAEASDEIVHSCRIVRDITGQPEVPFAFPYFGGGIDRAWLADLRRQHPCIGLYFDTDGLREDEAFVVQRVFGERFGHDCTLDATLRRAWAQPAAWRRRG
jgi:peptidoglycan/xylan/chitin deacetylase (PgdA/CDA1 family)